MKTIQEYCSQLKIENPWPINGIEVIPGAVPPDKFPNWFRNAVYLQELIKPNFLVCEIGSWVGKSTLFIADRSQFVIAIDPWPGSKEEYDQIADRPPDWTPANLKTAELLPYLYNGFLTNCWRQRDKILPLKMKSSQGLPMLYTAGIEPDLFYVDGEHIFETVYFDISTILTLFPASKICGNDWGFGGVQQAVNKCVKDFKKQLRTTPSFWELS